jgi:hypothetical protein
VVKRILQSAGCLLLLLFATGVRAQVQVGEDLRMHLNGLLTTGYQENYGDRVPTNHSLNYSGEGTLTGSYYNENFLNFSVTPYYNQSKADSNFQSLTDASGVTANANFFTGSRFPGNVNYSYSRNSTGNFGLIGSPNFTTVGTGYGFGIGWSVLIPDKPTFSVSYSQGSGSGNVFGTNEETSSSRHTLNLRSSYELAGWRLNAQYDYLNINTKFPYFLGGQPGDNFSDSSGNDFGINAIHKLPWNGSVALTYNHSTYNGDSGSTLSQNIGNTDYTTNTETANVSFHPTVKLTLFVNQTFTDNLNGFLYQNIANSGGGVPLLQTNSHSDSTLLSGGGNYTFTKNLYGQAQITYYNQTYFGQSYNGSFFSGTVGYNKRILDTFTVSATVIESTNKFANNSLGFIGNLNAFRHLGRWEASGNLSYAQNVQSQLVTYTTSYYNYSARIGRGLGRGKQWTGVYTGNHSGFSQQAGSVNKSNAFSTSLSLRRLDLNANYIKSSGQALLTNTGIQPIPPTPGLPPEGIIIYNGKSYGGGINLTPIPRLTISGNYSHATSDTLSSTAFSNNRTNIFYGQLQYRLRKISVLAGYTKFSQGISAAGAGSPGSQYSYFIGVTRWFNFF